MTLFNEITKNKSLNFIDAKTKVKYNLQDVLFDLGIIEKTQKQLVFLYCNNKVHSVGMYFSLLKDNFTIALLNEELDQNLKVELEKKYNPEIIIDQVRKKINYYNIVEVKSNSTSFYVFNQKQSQTEIHSKVKILLSTSGTTGSPKFVKLSQENIYENTVSISKYLPIKYNDVTPLNLPFYYSYGLSVLHSNALKGGTIICDTDDILSKPFWNQFEEFGFTSIAGVPFVYEMLDRIGFRKKKYPNLCYISQAGGNLNQKTKQRFLDYCLENKILFYVMYGQTEATARISFVPPEKLHEKITSIGKPIMNGKFSIDNDNSELIYEGPNVFGGYVEKISDLVTWDEIKHLRTGDLGKVDDDGYYFVTGRIKRIVKIFGNRVNLDDLESFFKNKFDETNFACIGLEDKTILVITDNDKVSLDKIKKVIGQELKIHSSVIKHKIINKFVLTSNGKINYKELEIRNEV